MSEQADSTQISSRTKTVKDVGKRVLHLLEPLACLSPAEEGKTGNHGLKRQLHQVTFG